MASDVPVKDLRPLAEWRDELGLDRLVANLIDGDLDAWWYDHATAEFHQIPQVHGQREIQWWEGYLSPQGQIRGRVEVASERGWSVKREGESLDLCTIYAARRVKHAGGPKPIYNWDAAYEEMQRYVRENGWPKKQAPLVSHIENWLAQR